jgi:predicted lipid carrier protein YhbT
MPAGVFARLAAGRGDPEALRRQVTIEGDSELGEQIVTNFSYTM